VTRTPTRALSLSLTLAWRAACAEHLRAPSDEVKGAAVEQERLQRVGLGSGLGLGSGSGLGLGLGLGLALTLTQGLSLTLTLTSLERSACSGATHAMHMLSSAAVMGSSRRASRRTSPSRRPVLWA